MGKEKKEAGEILAFLKSHDLIAIERLERKCNIPTTSLNRSLRTGKLPKKYIKVLEETLKEYGFK